MRPYQHRQPERIQINNDINPQNQKKWIQEEIRRKKQQSEELARKIAKRKIEHKQILQRLQKRTQKMMKYKQRQMSLWEHRNQPEYFLNATGLMNEFMNQYLISHHQQMGMQMQPNQVNPDMMTYEQLLQLGDSIGKVSKGISKQQFNNLERFKNIAKNESCAICVTDFELGEKLILLPCKHFYHEQCIEEWLSDENVCPMCKISVLPQKQ